MTMAGGFTGFRLAALAALLLALTACGRAPATPSQTEEQAAAKPATGGQCEVGKEVWRSPGPPRRGGTLIRSSDTGDHMDITKGGRTASSAMPQVYQGLLQLRGCFPTDTAVA